MRKAKIPGKQKASHSMPKSKATVDAGKKPKSKTLDKPGKSVVAGKGGPKAREKRLYGKAL